MIVSQHVPTPLPYWRVHKIYVECGANKRVAEMPAPGTRLREKEPAAAATADIEFCDIGLEASGSADLFAFCGPPPKCQQHRLEDRTAKMDRNMASVSQEQQKQ